MKEANINRLQDFYTVNEVAGQVVGENSSYIKPLMKELAGFQTYLAKSILQFSNKLKPEAAEDLFSLYLVVWGYYRQYSSCRESAVSKQQFERIHQRNISMFRYLDKEDDAGLFDQAVNDDHEKLTDGALLRYITHCFQTWPSLSAMDFNDFTVQLICMKSFVECFEELAA